MKRIIALALVLVCVLALFAGCKDKEEKYSDYVLIEIENYGSIKVGLMADVAPITVENFLKLVDEEFYTGTTFHRIISGFMIQGGAPIDPGYVPETIKGEFSSNGVENNLKHTRGVISMARTSVMDSASTQFFIMHETSPHLDGDYAAFGRVVEGMDVVDAICDTVPQGNNGAVPGVYQPVILSITRVDE